MATFTIYKDSKGEFRWRFRGNNSKIVADGAEGYKTKLDCHHGIEIVKKEAPGATVNDQSQSATQHY